MYYMLLLFLNFGFFSYLIFFIAKNKLTKIKELIAKVKEIIHNLKNP